MDAEAAREASAGQAVEDGRFNSTGMHALNERGCVNMLTSSRGQHRQPSQHVYCRTRQDPLEKRNPPTVSEDSPILQNVSESQQSYP